MDDHHRQILQWLSDQYFTEISSLESTEDNLFTWAISTMLAASGALTSLKGFASNSWGWTWRLLLIFGLIACIGAILVMAFLIHVKAENHRRRAAEVLRQIDPLLAEAPRATPANPFLFYMRWGGVTALGLVVIVLITLLG
jgi:hypothetical protein